MGHIESISKRKTHSSECLQKKNKTKKKNKKNKKQKQKQKTKKYKNLGSSNPITKAYTQQN